MEVSGLNAEGPPALSFSVPSSLAQTALAEARLEKMLGHLASSRWEALGVLSPNETDHLYSVSSLFVFDLV